MRKKMGVGIALFFALILLLFSSKVEAKEIVLVLDPGHGGLRSGTTNGNLIERDLVQKIANYLQEYLSQYNGIKVYLTHGVLSNEVEMELDERAIIAKNLDADMFISLHLNSYNGSVTGAESFVTAFTGETRYHQECSELAGRILNNLCTLGTNNRGVKTKLSTNPNNPKYSDGSDPDYYQVIRECIYRDIPAMIVEHCFLDNASDSQLVDSEEDLKRMAEVEGNAIVDYYGLQKRIPVTGVSLNETNIKLIEEETANLVATITPTNATNQKVTWTSSNNQVAIVDEEGKVTAKSKGIAIITVTTEDGAKVASATISVEPKKLLPEELEADPSFVVQEMDGKKVISTSLKSYKHGLTVEYMATKFAKGNLTIKQIKDPTGAILIDPEAKVGTGTEITVEENEETYTVLVYGDVNGNGVINSSDAYSVLSHVVGESLLKGIYKEAANVSTKNPKVNSYDSYRILQFCVGELTDGILGE